MDILLLKETKGSEQVELGVYRNNEMILSG